MKVYAVVTECDDYLYGYLAPDRIFRDKDKASEYANELRENDYYVVVNEYEVE